MSRLTPAGNPAGQFPPERHAALDAVFAAAKPFDPGKVAIPGVEIPVYRADALVWALGELDFHFRQNHLAAAELTASELSRRFHAIAAAADKLLKALGADYNASRFGQVRESLKHFAEQDAREAGGFPNHPPETSRVVFRGEEVLFTEFHADRQLEENIEGISQIRRWARQAEEPARRKQTGGSTGSDQFAYEIMEKGPEFKIFDEIFEIWEWALGREVHTSTSTRDGKASGPLIRFTRCCLELLGHSAITPDGIRWRVRHYMAKRDFQKT